MGKPFRSEASLDNHVYKNCQIDDCDLYYSGGQYELLDTHITNSRLILNHPAKGIYNALQIFKMKSPGSPSSSSNVSKQALLVLYLRLHKGDGRVKAPLGDIGAP